MGQAAGSSRQQQQATGSTAGLSAVVFGWGLGLKSKEMKHIDIFKKQHAEYWAVVNELKDYEMEW
jgi:hypothetical protein